MIGALRVEAKSSAMPSVGSFDRTVRRCGIDTYR